MNTFTRSGTIVDVINRRLYPGTVTVDRGKISSITEDSRALGQGYILPGFIDSHIHIESSMVIPSEFARMATLHGTVATVSDPHEIANVLGISGIKYMIQNGKQVPFHFYFGASSCVPATIFETAGASLTAKEIDQLFREDHLKYLSEVMNFPGVLSHDPLVMDKLAIAKAHHKPIDGHAPGVRGEDAQRYIAEGISTDHECTTLEEALEKIKYGMKILIREGSAAKNYNALHSLLKTHPDRVMFCSDDKHPHELVKGHINQLVRRSILEHGYDLFDVLRAACLNPIHHYLLDVGLLRPNDGADFIIVDDLKEFNVLETFINGRVVAINGKPMIQRVEAGTPNRFAVDIKKEEDFIIQRSSDDIRVIEAMDGQLITNDLLLKGLFQENQAVCDLERDLLKLTVVNRYQNQKPATAFIKNFGLKTGAIASCIAHDSHNIIAVGCSDEAICRAVNLLIKSKGGIAVVKDHEEYVLPLPVAGIMTNEDGFKVARKYEEMDEIAKSLGTSLHAPFMTLSFMALLVIPQLKLSDKGLFDVKKFAFVQD